MDQPTIMKAAVVDLADGPFRLSDVARPTAGPGQVLVSVKASGVNPLDLKIRAGAAAHARHPFPAVLGLDLAGVVVAAGEGVTRFRAGDEVWGMTGGVGGKQGSLAQFAAVDADLLARKPARLDFRQAAATPLGFITAWEGLVDRAKVSAGQTVLVHGGGGGVGHMAIQIALALGAQVFATGSAANADYIRSLGAEPIDYAAESVETYVERLTGGQGFDLIYDTGGGSVLDVSFKAVRRFGYVVSCLGWGSHSLAPLSFKAATYSGVFTLLPLLTGEGCEHHGEIMRRAAELADRGALAPRVDPRRFSLDEIEQAHEAAGRPAHGKIVVDIT